jgi:hypothetical protein
MIALGVCLPAYAVAGSVTVEHVWARATPKGAPNAAVYLTLVNNGSETDRLIGASSPVADNIQFHEERDEGGVSKMIALQAVDVAPGTPVVANDEASLQLRYGPAGQSSAWRVVVLSDGTEIRLDDAAHVSQVCCDGILVAGEPGRSKGTTRLGMTFHNQSFGDAAFLIDARGDLKPSLTAARTPPAARASEDPTWARLFSVSGRGYSKLLNEIVERCASSGEPDRFWLVSAGYGLDLYHLPLLSAWRHLRFPVRKETGAIEWYSVKDIGPLRLELPVDKLRPNALTLGDGRVLGLPGTVGENRQCACWLRENCVHLNVVGCELNREGFRQLDNPPFGRAVR